MAIASIPFASANSGQSSSLGEAPETKIFGTYELVEAVLIHLDMRTLLLSQRVSRTFRHVIAKSEVLRQHLWYIPTPYSFSTDVPDCFPSVSNAGLNPLLEDLVRRNRHPIISTLEFGKSLWRTEFPGGQLNPEVFITFLREGLQTHHAQGSWKDMIVLQPHESRFWWRIGVVSREHVMGPGCPRESFDDPPTAGKLLEHKQYDAVSYAAVRAKLAHSNSIAAASSSSPNAPPSGMEMQRMGLSTSSGNHQTPSPNSRATLQAMAEAAARVVASATTTSTQTPGAI